MDRLIELLNEYEENRIEKINSEWKLMVKLSFKPYTEESLTNKAYRSCQLEICSKYYGFIKWLVEKNKIDFSWEWEYSTKSIEEFDWLLRDDEDWLIMLLAISDTPIDDLINYLR